MRKIIRASASSAAARWAPDVSAPVLTGSGGGRTTDIDGGAHVVEQTTYNIVPEWGGGADLRAIPSDISNAVTVTDHAKQTDRGIRVVTNAPPVSATLTSGTATGDGVNRPGRRREDDSNLVCISGDITHTLKAEGFDGSEDGTGRGMPIVPDRKDPVDCVTANSVQHYDVKSAQAGHLLEDALAIDGRSSEVSETMSTITANQNGGGLGGRRYGTVFATAVRRLTPTECERLQGLPDGWTVVEPLPRKRKAK